MRIFSVYYKFENPIFTWLDATNKDRVTFPGDFYLEEVTRVPSRMLMYNYVGDRSKFQEKISCMTGRVCSLPYPLCPANIWNITYSLTVHLLSISIIHPTSLMLLRILRTDVYKHLAWYLPQSKHSGNFSSHIRYLLSFYFIFCSIYLKWQLQLLQVCVLPLIHVGGELAGNTQMYIECSLCAKLC